MLKQTCRNLWRHGVGFSQQNVEFQFSKTLVLIFMQTNKWKSSAKSLCIWLYKLIGYSPPIFGVKMLRSSSIEFRVRREWNVPKTICIFRSGDALSLSSTVATILRHLKKFWPVIESVSIKKK